MIEELTKENLIKYNFKDDEIERLLNKLTDENINNDNGNFIISKKDNKLYSGKDALRKIHFTNNKDYPSFPIEDLDLAPEYYGLKLEMYINKQKKNTGILFKESAAIKNFILEEKRKTKNTIDKDLHLANHSEIFKNKTLKHEAYEAFLDMELEKAESAKVTFPNSDEMTKWIEIFEGLDISEELNSSVVGKNLSDFSDKQKNEEKQIFYNDASVNFFINDLLGFKKRIIFLSTNKEKIQFIDGMKLPRPETKPYVNEVMEATIFKGGILFYDFIIAYRAYLANKTEIIDKVENKHPPHNPNLWSKDCYDLFKYLKEKYHTKYNKQLTNIWFYLKEYETEKYTLKATKDEYIEFIKEAYQITIKNRDKSKYKYEEKDKPTMNDHRIRFESLNKLQNT